MPLQPRRKTLQRYGICRLTGERWEKNPDLGFPAPTFINGRKYDDVEALDAWDAECAARARVTRAPARAGKSREINPEI
jgi:hypothetical protein